MNALERAIKEKIKYHMMGKETPLIFEVGAHHAEDTIQFYEIFENPTVLAFEPVYDNYVKAFNAICNMRGVKRPQIFNFAISNRSGRQQFYESSNDGLSGSLSKPKEHLVHYPDVKFTDLNKEVACMTLDGLRYDFAMYDQVVDLLWMDVQGHELQVIQGGKEFFKYCRFIYTEYSVSELYEGAPSLDMILKALGPNWELAEILWEYPGVDGNALLRRKV
jgi:FkbM family methyltransferase